MKTLLECNLCRGKKFNELLRGKDLMYRLPGEFILVRCKNCGLRFLNPQPTSEELSKHYPSEYYSVSNKIKRSKFSEFIYKTYFSESGNRLLRILFYPFYPILRTAKILPGKKILDIGCGSGVFLSRMQNLGMKTAGVDPYINKDIIELGIRKTTLDQVQGKYDVITMNNVLEHVPNPDETFAHIKRLLEKNGTAIIGVPNGKSLLFRIFKTNWAELDLPRHLFLFEEKNLKQYARKHKLAVKKVRYNSVPFEFTGTLFYLLDKTKPLAKSFLVHNSFLNLLFLPLAHLFILLKMGSRIEIILEHASQPSSTRQAR